MKRKSTGEPISPELIAEAAKRIENDFGISREKSIHLAAWAMEAYEAKGRWAVGMNDQMESWLETVVSHWIETDQDEDKAIGYTGKTKPSDSDAVPELILNQPLKFTYPVLIRIIMGIGGPAFLAASIFTSPLVREEGLALWVPLLFLVGGLGSLILLYIISGQYVIDNQVVTFRKLGREIHIPYSDVLMIEHQPGRDRLIIRGSQGRIVVHKVLKDYVLFYSLLIQFCPDREEEANLPFPLEVRTHRWLFIVPVIHMLGSLYLTYIGFQYSYIPLYILGPVVFFIGGWMFLGVPRKYVFDVRGLTKISLLGKKLYRADELYELQLNRPFNLYSYTETSVVVLKFESGKVILQDALVDFPLEVLARVLSERYPRLAYGPGSYDEEAKTAWPGPGPLSFRKKKTKRVALLIGIITFIGISVILFATRSESQFQSQTHNLAILEGYPDPGPWILLKSGPNAAVDTYHTWNQTSFGLFDPWIVIAASADDPLEYYQRIDLQIGAVYAIVTVFFAAAGREGMIAIIKFWNKQAKDKE
jgi:hypothetical protein